MALYAVKPAFRRVLEGLIPFLRPVHPDVLTWGALGCSVAAAVLFQFSELRRGLFLVIPTLLFLRIVLNALDGLLGIFASFRNGFRYTYRLIWVVGLWWLFQTVAVFMGAAGFGIPGITDQIAAFFDQAGRFACVLWEIFSCGCFLLLLGGTLGTLQGFVRTGKADWRDFMRGLRWWFGWLLLYAAISVPVSLGIGYAGTVLMKGRDPLLGWVIVPLLGIVSIFWYAGALFFAPALVESEGNLKMALRNFLCFLKERWAGALGLVFLMMFSIFFGSTWALGFGPFGGSSMWSGPVWQLHVWVLAFSLGMAYVSLWTIAVFYLYGAGYLRNSS